MSFDLGPAHLALAVAGLVVLVRSKRGTRRTLALTFGAIALGGAWLTTHWSIWLWPHIRLLQYVQFPWRALSVPGLFLSLLAVFALERLGNRWAAVVLTVLVAINLAHTEPK